MLFLCLATIAEGKIKESTDDNQVLTFVYLSLYPNPELELNIIFNIDSA